MIARALAAVVIVGLAAAPAAAAPQVTIHAHTRIQIDRVARSDGGIRVSGRLLDSVSGLGIPDRDVEIHFGPGNVTVQSGHDGAFEADFSLPPDVYELDVQFAGDPFYAKSSHAGQRFDIGKLGVTLYFRGVNDVQPEDDALVGEIAAIPEDGIGGTGGELPISLSVTDATGKGEPMRVAVVNTSDGIASFSIPRAKLGHAGDKRLHASFAGNEDHNPADVESRFRLVSSTRIADLDAPNGAVRYEGRIKIGGRLVEQDGTPVEAATLHLEAGSQRVASTLSDRNGRFTLRVAAKEFPPGPVSFTVEYASTTSWRRGTQTTSIPVTIAQPRPVPVGYTVLGFVLAAGALAAYLLVRTRPWVAWLEAWNRRRRRQGSAPETAINGTSDVPPATGLKAAKAGIMSTLRRPADFGFTGRVRDVLTAAPLADAQIELLPDKSLEGSTEIVIQTDEQGGFAIDRLPAGLWRARVSARGYMTEAFHVTIPHRGELRGARVDLLPVREKVFAIYRGVAQPLLPKPELWGVWTPREIFDHVRRKRPAGALGALTDFVEETYFSPRTPEEAIIPSAEASARAARHELVSPGQR